MSDIPQARRILEEALITTSMGPMAQNAVREALELMKRPLPARRAPPRNRPVDRQLVRDVRELADTTNLSQQDIAVKLGTNAGRVSEILSGRRNDAGELVE